MEKQDILKMHVPRLREAVIKLGSHKGVSGMNKEKLIEALFRANDIPLKEALDTVKNAELKKGIKKTREEWRAALEAKDKKKAKILQRRLHRARRITRSWTKAKVRAKASKAPKDPEVS